MAINFAHYSGREPAFVKHTFLDRYLPPLVGKVCSSYDEFVYVDGFAGPWKSAAGETFNDTSFGIALNHMTAQRLLYLSKGRDIRMRAFLVEKEANSFKQLQSSVGLFPKIEVIPLHGTMELHATQIAASIPASAFSFTLIDPKGFPQIDALTPLLQRQNAEALVNFMFDFATRFAETDLIPALENWLSTYGGSDWKAEVAGLSGDERESKLSKLAAESLRSIGQYRYAPVISVDKAIHNRTLYKLIFLSRHHEGLKVFRDSEEKALTAQAEARSVTKAKKRSQGSAMDDLFSDGVDAVPNDRSAQVLKQSRGRAVAGLASMITAAGDTGMSFGNLWPEILESNSITRSALGRYVNDLRKAGKVIAPDWPNSRKQIPDDTQRLIWVG